MPKWIKFPTPQYECIEQKFGGATTDANIWEASQINVMLQQIYEADRHNHSLGDSGYPLRPWIITPYRSANEDERRFNKVHAQARNCVKRLKGVLKSVFRCLQIGLNTTPQTSGKIIYACTVLHNFRLEHGMLPEEYIADLDSENKIPTLEEYEQHLREASSIRDRLKSRFFNSN